MPRSREAVLAASRRPAPVARWLRRACLFGLALVASACLKKPYPRAGVVDSIALEGARSIDEDELLAGLATTGTPRFLGIWDGVVFDYSVYDEDVLARDLERVERYYRARGFYEAKVTAARVVHTDEHHVEVFVSIVEGEQVFVGSVDAADIARLPPDVQVAAYTASRVLDGHVFDERSLEDTKQRIANEIADRGFAFVRVVGAAKVTLSTHSAQIKLCIDPGPRVTLGAVSVAGNSEIDGERVLTIAGLREGDTYSRREMQSAESALLDLGVFSSVDVGLARDEASSPLRGKTAEQRCRPEDIGVESGSATGTNAPSKQAEPPPEPQRPETVAAVIRVQEGSLRTVKVGGGTRIDPVLFETTLITGWEHKNFLGELRHLTIEARPGVDWFPTRIPSAPGETFQAPSKPLLRHSVRARLEQPAFAEARTTGFLETQYAVFPLLYPNLRDGDLIIGYNDVSGSTGVFRGFGPHVRVTTRYNLRADFPFMYSDDPVPAGLDRVVASYPELSFALDWRDDRVRPRSGVYFQNSVQVAGYAFGGDVSDVKVEPELRAYKPLNRKKTVAIAIRARVGFLFPTNYGDSLEAVERNPNLASTPAARTDQHKLLFRAFYSGGPDSNRGYPYQGVGPWGPLGFLNPSGFVCEQANGQLIERPECLKPLGGLSLWEASAEIRFHVAGPLDMATFLDGSDVNRQVGQISFDAPHLSTGLGIRYATPIGPIRFDLGYRLPSLQVIGQTEAQAFPRYGNAGTIFGAPMALSFALGESF